MATYTWANAGTSGTFEVDSNWTGGTSGDFPGSSDTALLIGAVGSTQTITGPADVSALYVSGLNYLTGTFVTGFTRVDAATGPASLELSGSLSASTGLIVGDEGSGALTVDAATTLSASSSNGELQAILGDQTGASGTLTVDGGGAMNLIGQAETSNYGFFVGDAGSGELVVTGAGSTVNDENSDGVVAGFSANSSGTILIEDGATADFGASDSNALSAIAVGRLGAGALTIDGSGSVLNSDGGIYIGRGAAGTLVISNSGVLNETTANTYVEIGDGSSSSTAEIGGTGSATVDNGTLMDAGYLRIGGYGVSGALTVDDGGLVSAVATTLASGIDLGLGGTVDGDLETGSGTLDVDAGSTVMVTGSASPGFAGMSVGADTGATGVVNVSGAGAVLNLGSNLLDVGNSGTGTLNIGDGGSVSASSPGTSYGAAVIGNSVGGVGALNITGAGSTLSANGALTVGFQGTGSLSLIGGGDASAGEVYIGYFGGAGAATVGNGSTLSSSDQIGLGGGSANGTLALLGGLADGNSVFVAAGSQVTLDGGTLDSVTDPVSNSGGIIGSGTIEGGVVSEGTVTASGGTLAMTDVIGGSGVYDIAASSELDLMGGAAGSIVTFAGADATLDLPSSLVSFTGTVDGFNYGDEMLAVNAASVSLSGDVLSVFDSGKGLLGTIDVTNVAVGGTFQASDGVITLACFLAGTRLATPGGEVAVEALAEGDAVLTADGAPARVRWIGHCTLDCARQPKPQDVWPVRILPGAFGEGGPARELWLSPDHAVFVAGRLIPVRYLVNGRTIAQEPRAQVTYYHVELPQHGLVLAEGLECESFLDTGNRSAFANGGVAADLHPDFARGVWAAEACAPLVLDGPELAAARARLLRRAAALGHRTTAEPALRVLADGVALRPQRQGRRWHLHLPPGARQMRLLSRVWVPAETRAAESDARRLGVAIGALWLDGRQAALDSPGFGAGWYPAEPDWRWTDGAAELSVDGVRELAFDVALTGTYWQEPRRATARAA